MKHGSFWMWGVVGIALAPASCAKSGTECPVECGTYTKCCDGVCVDVVNNKDNCGYCGNACPGGTICSAGECKNACGTSICPAGRACCEDECVDTTSDTGHCGECGTACAPNQSCVSGLCVSLSCTPECEGGKVCCKTGSVNSCVDLQADRNNCGTCGTKCGPNQVCKSGACSADVCDPACATGTKCCGGACVDTQADTANCGFCGNTCDAEKADGCTAGQCSCKGALECRSDQKCCTGVGCRAVSSDPSNCGACGNVCPSMESCVTGTCLCGTNPTCAAPSLCCSGACVDATGDTQNCGACGTVCGESGPDCVAGTCMCGSTPACPWGGPGGFMSCMQAPHTVWQKCCGGACVMVDEQHCGSCDTACTGDQECQGMFLVGCTFRCSGGTPP